MYVKIWRHQHTRVHAHTGWPSQDIRSRRGFRARINRHVHVTWPWPLQDIDIDIVSLSLRGFIV